MGIDLESIKNAIKKNPEGHERLTGRYYWTAGGVVYVNGTQPKPIGAVRIPSFSDDHPYVGQRLDNEELAELLARMFIDNLIKE